MTKIQFHKLKSEDQRVLIAKDVIERLGNGRFRARTGSWLLVRDIDSMHVDPLFNNFKLVGQELQPILNCSNCMACATGALFASVVCMYDDFKIMDRHVNSGLFSDDVADKLKAYFDLSQLMLIEAAFEGGKGYWDRGEYLNLCDYSDDSQKIWQSALKYRKELSMDRDVMLGIMQNIIDNNGTFDPLKV